jgi:RNA polymerase sigma-70 factor (ECF subfamily)
MKNDIKDNSISGSSQRGERFMKLYTAMQRRLYGYVISLMPDAAVTEDIIQETVTLMWKEFDKFEPGTDFVAWSFCIARNQIYNYIKRRQAQKKHFSPQAIEAIEAVVEEKSKNTDLRYDTLRKCIAKLPEKDRELLALRYEVGATLKTVSQRVEQSINTLYSRLYRIRIMLMNCIQKTLARETLL